MADEARSIPTTIHALVLDLPNLIGFGPTPEAARANLLADLADAEIDEDGLDQAYPLALTGTPADLRRFVVDSLGRDAGRHLATIAEVL